MKLFSPTPSSSVQVLRNRPFVSLLLTSKCVYHVIVIEITVNDIVVVVIVARLALVIVVSVVFVMARLFLNLFAVYRVFFIQTIITVATMKESTIADRRIKLIALTRKILPPTFELFQSLRRVWFIRRNDESELGERLAGDEKGVDFGFVRILRHRRSDEGHRPTEGKPATPAFTAVFGSESPNGENRRVDDGNRTQKFTDQRLWARKLAREIGGLGRGRGEGVGRGGGRVGGGRGGEDVRGGGGGGL